MSDRSMREDDIMPSTLTSMSNSSLSSCASAVPKSDLHEPNMAVLSYNMDW